MKYNNNLSNIENSFIEFSESGLLIYLITILAMPFLLIYSLYKKRGLK